MGNLAAQSFSPYVFAVPRARAPGATSGSAQPDREGSRLNIAPQDIDKIAERSKSIFEAGQKAAAIWEP
ncbi:hypothetical protein AB0O52_02515 [Arthrobacter sp. NPDC080073]|uniref:hypothetical protein n=1 Tax=Arthrobacter sp. NPDC080073 TaxID=3155919 RepID=UPI00344607A0